MKTIKEYRIEIALIQEQATKELEQYALDWFKGKENLRFRSGMGTWSVEAKYKDTDEWVTIDDYQNGMFFGYNDKEHDDYILIEMPFMNDYIKFIEVLEDWASEGIYLSIDINC